MTEDLELGELLSSHYGQPIPSAEYHAILVRRLHVAARAARRRAWAVGTMAAAACLLLMITSGWWIRTAFDRTPPAAKPAPVVASPLPTNPGVAVAPSNRASGEMFRSSIKLGDISPAQALSAASLVVRVRIDGVNGTLVHYTILRTIIGETETKSLDLDFTYGNPAMLAQFQKILTRQFCKE